MRNLTRTRKSTLSLSPRRVLAVLGIGTAVSLLGDSTLYTVLPDPRFALQAAVPVAQVGILLGVNRLVRILFNTPVGRLIDRFPRRTLMIGSLALGALSTLVYAAGAGFWVMLLGRVLWGAAWSGLWIGGQAIVLDLAGSDNRGHLSGRYQMWFFLGIGISALLGGLFTDLLGYRGGLWLSAALTAAAALLWFFLLPETVQPAIENPHDGQRQGTRYHWRIALISSLPIFTMRFIFAGVIAATSIIWLSQFVGESASVLGLVIPIATLTGTLVASRTAVSVLGAPLAGFFSDRIGQRWTVIGITLIIGAIGLWFMGSAVFPVALLGVLLSSPAGSIVQAMTTAFVGDRVPPNMAGRTISMIFTFGDLGSALGPLTAFWLMGSLPLAMIFHLCAAMSLGTAVVVFLLQSAALGDR